MLTTLRQGSACHGFAKIMRDLSDREQARQELHTVLAVVSHELHDEGRDKRG